MLTQGSLTVVGTGIKAVSHITAEAEAHIKGAEKLFYLVADPVVEHWLKQLNPAAEDLYRFYSIDKDRMITYEQIIECLVSSAQAGRQVCCALYGHPSVFAYPGRESVRRLREMHIPATVLPAVSAEDCLFADLGIDPGSTGCQSFEATDFLIHQRRFDVRSSLVLWQIAIIGVRKTPSETCNLLGLNVLAQRLLAFYPPEHEVVVYEAAQIALCQPRIVRVPLSHLTQTHLSPLSTLYLPPYGTSEADPSILASIGLAEVVPVH